jgi:hypothetical protein
LGKTEAIHDSWEVARGTGNSRFTAILPGEASRWSQNLQPHGQPRQLASSKTRTGRGLEVVLWEAPAFGPKTVDDSRRQRTTIWRLAGAPGRQTLFTTLDNIRIMRQHECWQFATVSGGPLFAARCWPLTRRAKSPAPPIQWRAAMFRNPVARAALHQLVSIVHPDTLLRWIREARKGRQRLAPKGQRRTAEDIRRLILKLGRETG